MHFKAFDCRKPSEIISYRKFDWCKPLKAKNTLGDDDLVANENFILVQKQKFQSIKGIKCTKQVSTFLLYCGTYGHMKLMNPPSILEPELLSVEDCRDMYQRRAYIFNGQTVKLRLK